MKKIFQYTILQYIHSPHLGEALNLGILFYFRENDTFIFKYPENISRINGAYLNFEDALIKKYLKDFTKTAKNLKLGLFPMDILNVANDFFLPKDDSVLQFNKYETSFYDSNNIKEIVEEYYQIYFENYISQPKTVPNAIIKNEKYLISTLENILVNNFPEKKKLFVPTFTFQNEKTKIKADYFWQNGTGNIIKAISLDLKDSNNINEKAILCAGKLNYLAEEAYKKNYRIDLIVSKPSNPDLYDEYFNSLEILKESDINKKIVLEEDLQQYTNEAAKSVIPCLNNF